MTGSLEFHSPLSPERARRIVDRLARNRPSTVLDIGSGWGALLLQVLDAVPRATGVGIDVNTDDLARGRKLATARGLADRVEFAEESGVGTTRGPADLVICVGSGHALTERPGDFAGTLRELRRLVAPGGRVLYAEGFWQRAPTDVELARMWPGAAADDHTDLAGLVEMVVDAGFRPVWSETASEDEWEQFESGYQADLEEWIAAHPGHPEAEIRREKADGHRASWLGGYRNVLGMAYLTLAPVG
ncbi:class I SAM-dependent methyltransferase [Cryptosporangium sp. NPDC048952]|uniref:class I SAM-dependent methyltransferase n=1 Tax=Cryptosporangium sp. NPDC048952 TaxID=3363961 RepID=UPI00371BB37C